MFSSLSRNFIFFTLSDSLYYSSSYAMVNAFLSILITSRLTDRIDIVGFVMAYYMIVRVATEVPMSTFTKKLSRKARKNLVSINFAIYGVGLMLLGYTTEIWHIFALQTLFGFLDATNYPLKWTLFPQILDKSKEELEWSLEDSLGSLFPAIAAVAAGIISERYQLPIVFIMFGTLMIISAIIFSLIDLDKHFTSRKPK